MNTFKLANRVWQDPVYFCAFGFGSGLSSFMPGTCGTLAAIPIFLLIAASPVAVYLTFTCVAFIFGVFICNKVSFDLGVKDYSGIVWDEIVGYLLTMFMFPATFSWMITGFILFRIFDIWKPQPIKFIDKNMVGGLGIMLDDVLAALFAWVIMRLLFQISH